MAISKFTEFNLPSNAYAAFDAVSMKQLITNRIKASGLFPDIDFEGSNISGMVDIVAYMYHVLLFYLNQTASESMFTQTELYENMNKLVSLIGYKPQGYNAPLVSITCTALAGLPIGMHAVKRFSYTYVNNIPYTFNQDVVFEKTAAGDELITSVGDKYSMHQGMMKEYPLYTAIGENFEEFTITIANPLDELENQYIDNNNIFVYIKDISTGLWNEWIEVTSLYVSSARDRVFEKRFNESGRYEIKFGDSITGRRLNAGDVVAVYYLVSNGVTGVIAANALAGKTPAQLNTTQWNEIFNDVKNTDLEYISPDDLQYVSLDNPIASTPFTSFESLDAIKNNAPLIFSTQNRTVTVEDFESTVLKYYNNIIHDVRAVSNQQYTSEYLKYFYDIGLERPNDDERVMMNQVMFTDACDFNNVYLFAVPQVGAIQNGITPIALATAQKQVIVNRLNLTKQVNQNIVVCDPVYLAFSFGLTVAGEEPATEIKDETILRIRRQDDYTTSKELIKGKVADIIRNTFTQQNNVLAGTINITQLNIDILDIPGVKSIETVRQGSESRVVPKINMIVWNPFYPDATPDVTSQNIQLRFFEFPFFYDIDNISTKIEVL
jgi:hypothetical protein